MYHLEASSKGRLICWALALIWTLIWIISGFEGNQPELIYILFIFSWLALLESYVARAVLKFINRSKPNSEISKTKV